MELFRLLGRIVIDNTEANRAISETADRADEGSKKTTSAFKKIGEVGSKIATGLGVAGAAIGGAFIASVEGTREYRKEMGLLESAFLTAGHSSDEAKKTYSDLNAVMGDSGAAVEASQHLALVTDNQKELDEMTHALTGVYATFGASLPLEGLAEAMNHTASLGEVQGSLADALEWSGITVDDFNAQLAECSTEQERQDLIMKTLKDTYSEAADQYKETNKDVMDAEKANEALADAFSELGRIGEPILIAIKEKIAEMVTVAAPKLQELIDKVKDGIKWVQENKNTIDAWVAVIIGATTSVGLFLLILNWGKIMTAATTAIKGVTAAVKLFNLALKSNPIGLVISIIAGLVAAIIYLWNTNEDFRRFWINAWNKIKDVAKEAWESIKKAWNKAGEWFGGIWKSITSVFSGTATWFKNTFSKAWNNIKSVFSGWGSFFGGLWNAIKNKFTSIGTSISNAVGTAVKKGINGVIGGAEKLINGFIGQINGAIKWINKIPGVNISKIAKVSFARLAEGGVLEKGQVGLLEGSGAEAVVPLEKNKQWIDKVSDAFMDNMNVSNVMPEQLIDKMNQIIKLLGKLLERDIYLDTGVLVGELASPLDAELGRKYKVSKRNNI